MSDKRKDRTTRRKNHCTSCGEKLPKVKKQWGLIWEDGAGFCRRCLFIIRYNIGYFERFPDELKDYEDLNDSL